MKLSPINLKFGMNVHHTPLVHSVSFNSIEPIGERCTISHNKTCKYPYNFIQKTVPITASSYPKIKILTLILLEKLK